MRAQMPSLLTKVLSRQKEWAKVRSKQCDAASRDAFTHILRSSPLYISHGRSRLSVTRHVQDEFLDTVFWGRQLISLCLGVVFGVAGLMGFPAFALFAPAPHASDPTALSGPWA